jgi:hypothetical protein
LLHNLQPPKEDDVPIMAEHILQLEQFPNLDSATICNTKIHDVLEAINKLQFIPLDDQFKFKTRSVSLLEKMD